jgi:hypothetical protein
MEEIAPGHELTEHEAEIWRHAPRTRHIREVCSILNNMMRHFIFTSGACMIQRSADSVVKIMRHRAFGRVDTVRNCSTEAIHRSSERISTVSLFVSMPVTAF